MPVPTDAMKREAKRGLEWRREFGRGGTAVGIARARDISNGRDLSIDTVRRMKAYFDRHEIDKDAEGFRPGEDGYPSNGRIAWALWGGDPGYSWAMRIMAAENDDRGAELQHPAKGDMTDIASDYLGTDMADREIRTLSESVEIRSDDDNQIRVAGYAAVFGQETKIGGAFTEVIAPGAFRNALERGDDVVFLVNHDGLPLARTRSGTLLLSEDERGLYMETVLDGSDPDVRALVPKMKRGDLDKMSFAFIPLRQSWDESGEMPKRTIEDVSLHDVSIVTTPAYEGTEIGLRSLEAFRAEKRQQTQAIRRLRMKRTLPVK